MKGIGTWLALLCAGGLQASTIAYTNFGPGMTYNTGSGHLVSQGWGEAQIFNPSASGTLSEIDLGLAYFGSAPQFSLSVSLQTDQAGIQPSGTVLESWTLNTNQVGSSAAVISLSSALMPSLSSGTSYWLVLRANPNDNNGYDWLTNTQGVTGLDYDNGTGWQQGVGTLYPSNAFDVVVNSGAASPAAPEPGSWALFSVALIGLAIRRRRVTARHTRSLT